MATASYATEPTLGRPVAAASYATEPTLGRPVAQDSVVNEAKTVEQITEPRIVHNVQEPQTDYHEVAVRCMKAGKCDDAFAAFEILAEKEGYEVMYNEVIKYFSNEIVISNHAEDAVYWFDKCVQNCRDSWTVSLAEFQLGEIYSKGLGVKKNHKIAEKYYAGSAAKGNMYAKKKFVAGKYVK